MKPKGNTKLVKQMEAIQHEAHHIASEATDLIKISGPATATGGNVSPRLRRLQASVDRLRRSIWRVRSSEPEGLPIPAPPAESPASPSLVDRVIAIVDHRSQ